MDREDVSNNSYSNTRWHWCGGVAVLAPGYVLKVSHNLVQGRAVATLIADRTSQYYIVSVLLHSDKVRKDLALLSFKRYRALLVLTLVSYSLESAEVRNAPC